jgi:hypothetical protein
MPRRQRTRTREVDLDRVRVASAFKTLAALAGGVWNYIQLYTDESMTIWL